MLSITLLVSALATLVVAGWVVDRVRRLNRTKRVRAVGFPLQWLPLVERSLPVYGNLPFDLRESIQEKAFAKLTDLAFSGARESGEVTDLMRVSLGVHLGVLHAHLRIPPTPAVRHVIVGAAADIAVGLEAPGCPWGPGTLVTIWEPAVNAARSARDERDAETMNHWRRLRPGDDPAPSADHLYFAGWARSLREDAADRLPALAERVPELAGSSALFAAASEAFIRHPHALLEHHPALYHALKFFYQFDPARWTPAPHRPAVSA